VRFGGFSSNSTEEFYFALRVKSAIIRPRVWVVVFFLSESYKVAEIKPCNGS